MKVEKLTEFRTVSPAGQAQRVERTPHPQALKSTIEIA
jgi:hypothetical protein